MPAIAATKRRNAPYPRSLHELHTWCEGLLNAGSAPQSLRRTAPAGKAIGRQLELRVAPHHLSSLSRKVGALQLRDTHGTDQVLGQLVGRNYRTRPPHARKDPNE